MYANNNNSSSAGIDLPLFVTAPDLSEEQALACARAVGLDAELLRRNLSLVRQEPFTAVIPAVNPRVWQQVLSAEAVQHFLQIADIADGSSELSFDQDCYLEYFNCGKRANYELFLVEKSRLLCALAIAECVLGDGHHLNALVNQLTQWLQMPTWVAPAHDRKLENLNGHTILVDLSSSVTAHNLAIVCLWLEDRLPAEMVAQVRAGVYARAVAPYIHDLQNAATDSTWWRNAPHNWNAVCHAGVIGALLALPGRVHEKALVLTSAETLIRNIYLGSFSSDGYCPEGLGYWNYGFGQFMATALLLRDYTDNAIRWDEFLPAPMIGNFPADYQLHDGIFPTFCDCYPANNRLDSVNGRMARALFGARLKPDYEYSSGQWSSVDSWHSLGYRLSLFARSLQQYTDQPDLFRPSAAVSSLPAYSSFGEAQIRIARRQRPGELKFSFAAKGGSNSVQHNHNQNDLGSWVVALGQSLLLVDPGMDVYSPANFDQRRYSSPVNNSYGHPVPVVDGQLQSVGEQFRSRILTSEETEDGFTLSFDLSAAYAVKGLKLLSKEFVFSQSDCAALCTTDRFEADRPIRFETCVLTFSNIRIEGNEVWVWNGGDILRIRPESSQGAVTIVREHINAGRMQPERIGFALPKRVRSGHITLAITPESELPFSA